MPANKSIDTDVLSAGFACLLSAGHLQLQGLPHLVKQMDAAIAECDRISCNGTSERRRYLVKGADSETTNGHWCSGSALRTLMKDARGGLNR